MENSKYKSYLISLGEIIKEYALEAKKNKDKLILTDQENYATGYLSGFHRIVTLMKQQAEAYDIPLSDLGLEEIDEADLI